MKVRAADADLLPSRSLYHQDTGELIKDYLKYDEVPGVTNCSVVTLPPGMVIERHVHPSKYEIFLTSGGRGVFKVWAPGAADGDEARETSSPAWVCCTIGPENLTRSEPRRTATRADVSGCRAPTDEMSGIEMSGARERERARDAGCARIVVVERFDDPKYRRVTAPSSASKVCPSSTADCVYRRAGRRQTHVVPDVPGCALQHQIAAYF